MIQHHAPLLELHPVPLAVVKPDRLHPLVAVQRPGKCRRRVLAAGKQYQSPGTGSAGGNGR